ncbi:MAG: Ig-like domain-containing protein [Propionibacteriaceae bacterium]|nr:Ig-like domain-containing protein [Propionibacteriaceae bacterium]
MRKILLSTLAGVLAATGLAVTIGGQQAAVAAPGDRAARLGDISAGSLADYGDVAGWVEANADLIRSQGYDPEAAATEPTAAEAANITIDDFDGTISVGASCAAQTKVGYAIGDADAVVDLTLSFGILSFPENAHALDFTVEESLSLVPPFDVTLHSAGKTDAVFTIDLTEGTVTRKSGSADFDTVIEDNETALIDAIRDEMGDQLQEGLSEGLVDQLAENISFNLEYSTTLPFTFGYPFGPAAEDQLSNGQTATINLANNAKGSWVDDFAGEWEIPADDPLRIKTLSWSDLVPASVRDHIVGTPGAEYLDDIDIVGEGADQMMATINESLSLIKSNGSKQILEGINEGMKEVDGTAPLEDHPELTVSIPALSSSSQRTTVANRLGDLISEKIEGDWYDAVIEDGFIDGSVEGAFTIGDLTSLVATGVTSTPVAANLSAGAAVTLEPGDTAMIQPTVSAADDAVAPTGTPTYTYTSSDQSVATVSASGEIAAVADGSAVITVTATWPCSAGTPVTATATKSVTVATDTPVDPGTYCQAIQAASADLAQAQAILSAIDQTDMNAFIAALPSLGQVFLKAGDGFAAAGQTADAPAAAKDALATYSTTLKAVGEAGAKSDLGGFVAAFQTLVSQQDIMDTISSATVAKCAATLTITTPTAGAVLKDTKPVVAGTAANATTVHVASGTSTCDATVADGAWSCPLGTALGEGPATITATVTGTTVTATVDVVIDSTIVLKVVAGDPTAVEVTTDASAQVTGTIGGATVCSGNADTNGTFTCRPNPAAADGAQLTIRATDAAGNTKSETVTLTKPSPSPSPSASRSATASTSPSPSWSPRPTPSPSATRTAIPSASASTVKPSPSPSPAPPSASPTTAKPSATPTTAQPSATPTTAKPSATPTTAKPSATPTTAKPSATPTTAQPSATPTPAASATPSASPSPKPSAVPSASPTPGPGPSITLDRSTVSLNVVNGVGQPTTLTVTGQGFQAGEKVSGVVKSDPINLPAQAADALGKVVFTVTLPGTFEEGAHTVTLTGETSGPASVPFTIVRVVETPAPSPSPSASAPACPGTGVTMTQSGSVFTFTGTGFPAGTTVSAELVRLDGTATTSIAKPAAQVANSSGQVTFTWTSSSTTTDGTYEMRLSGAAGCTTPAKQFKLTTGLAVTGPSPETNLFGLLGLLALAVGGLSLAAVAQTRRRSA